MINARIIPEIPSSGSLGASGDLAFLARLGRAMMGDSVPVWYQDKRVSADIALKEANIPFFSPKAKEGLALINGTSFMTSMLALSFHRQLIVLDNLMALQGLFLNAARAIDEAFYPEIQEVRNQEGQKIVASILMQFFENSDVSHREEFQNDYCIRCIPQILGPRIEAILEQGKKLEAELNAVTDNPLIFRQRSTCSNDRIGLKREFNGEEWGVFSGGNFHGENLTVIADTIALSNAKIAITLERQIAYLLNPQRNGNKLPCYLIEETAEAGMKSGFMIPHYTANALVHKICLLAQPSSLMNATSANESEDVVSYGATACQKLGDQMECLTELLTIYATTVTQAYSIMRKKIEHKNRLAESVFSTLSETLNFPIGCQEGFGQTYEVVKKIVESSKLASLIGNPLKEHSKCKIKSMEGDINYVNC